MSSIIRQKVGDKIYLYESVSYRNVEGKPRNKRVPIGKIDPSTGQPIYKPDYLARMAACGAFVEMAASTQTFTADDIRRSSVLEFGAMYLLQSIAQQIGLLHALQSALPNVHLEIFTLACYLVSSGDPFLYCEEWLSKTSCPAVGSLSSQRISDLLQTITPDGREAFYQAWCQLRCEQEYLALDITSTSSYSDLIQDVEWGYNRDREQLPQINICMLMGETSRLPIYQVLYSGSLKDVSTLETTLSKMDAVSGGKPTLAVMDKGFFSTRNVNAMLNRTNPIRFVIAIPFTSQFAKKMVVSERKDIDCLQHTLVIGDDSLRTVTKERAWNEKQRLHTHVYYHAMKALKLREELYAHVTVLKDRAEADPKAALQDESSKKYLIIRKSENTPSGYTVNIREEVVAKELETAGWLVILSNDVSDAKEALSIYRQKDVVEKGFLRLKSHLDLGRLRVHRDDSMQNKVFIGFIALILMSHLHKVMLDKGLYRNMTMKKLLLTLSKLRVQHINSQRILFPLTKEQKAIYTAFAVQEPV
nr:IS1634 family transposase [Bradyrhizobium japonicum]